MPGVEDAFDLADLDLKLLQLPGKREQAAAGQ
jgi:hypothetical protein